MASSGSSRDDSSRSNNNNTNQQNDNIFVQFRRNVDHQISSILHSFIGVPSHMRRNEKEEDNRWQDIEDERARRIEERAQREEDMASQQKSGPPATIDRAAGSYDGHEYDIPVRRFQSPVQAVTAEESKCPELDYDYDLYSPFGQNEYERLMAACKIERPSHLRILSGVQERFYSSMLDTHHGNQLSEMAKEKTLMPYLLFSNYSPLRLTHLPPLRRRDMPPMLTFSYAEAFEDLLEMSKNDKSPWDDTENFFAFGASILNELGVHTGLGHSSRRHPVSSSMSAMEWIATSLVEKDVFRENSLYETIETPIGTFRAGQYSATTEVLLNWSVYKDAYEHAIARDRGHGIEAQAIESPFKWPKELERRREGEVKEPRTEQDMYDDFFSTPSAARVTYMDKDDDDEEVDIPVKTSNASTKSLGTQTSVLYNAPQSSPPESESHTNPWSWSSIQKPSSPSEEKVVLVSNVPGASDSSSTGSSENSLVSHEVTEESETLADGTVKTTVITKKKFGNGKSQVVISTSFDKPAERGKDGNGKAEVGAGTDGKEGKGVVGKVKEWLWQ